LILNTFNPKQQNEVLEISFLKNSFLLLMSAKWRALNFNDFPNSIPIFRKVLKNDLI
jgi:hypothetical protein